MTTDEASLIAPSTFGGVIPTPALERGVPDGLHCTSPTAPSVATYAVPRTRRNGSGERVR
jgi:hypothetical protein